MKTSRWRQDIFDAKKDGELKKKKDKKNIYIIIYLIYKSIKLDCITDVAG